MLQVAPLSRGESMRRPVETRFPALASRASASDKAAAPRKAFRLTPPPTKSQFPREARVPLASKVVFATGEVYAALTSYHRSSTFGMDAAGQGYGRSAGRETPEA
ncbi:MAG: hypothetical protein ACOVMO_14920 [Caulobacter sp.]